MSKMDDYLRAAGRVHHVVSHWAMTRTDPLQFAAMPEGIAIAVDLRQLAPASAKGFLALPATIARNAAARELVDRVIAAEPNATLLMLYACLDRPEAPPVEWIGTIELPSLGRA
jgi:hypothetical protein